MKRNSIMWLNRSFDTDVWQNNHSGGSLETPLQSPLNLTHSNRTVFCLARGPLTRPGGRQEDPAAGAGGGAGAVHERLGEGRQFVESQIVHSPSVTRTDHLIMLTARLSHRPGRYILNSFSNKYA